MTQENKDEILQAIHNFSDQTEKRFDKLEGKFDGLENKFDKLDKRVIKIEATMVTKDYLDEKLADLRGDLVVLTRKEDKKVMALVDILKQRKLIDDTDVKKILSMEPFPQNL